MNGMERLFVIVVDITKHQQHTSLFVQEPLVRTIFKQLPLLLSVYT